MLNKPSIKCQILNMLPKWRNLAKYGHTKCEQQYTVPLKHALIGRKYTEWLCRKPKQRAVIIKLGVLFCQIETAQIQRFQAQTDAKCLM